eukprot:gene2237-2951_t
MAGMFLKKKPTKYASKKYRMYCPNFPPRPIAEVQAEEAELKRQQAVLEREQAAEIRKKLDEKGFTGARGAEVSEIEKEVEKMNAME